MNWLDEFIQITYYMYELGRRRNHGEAALSRRL